MKRGFSIVALLTLSLLRLSILNGNAAEIGTWKAYMAYHDIKEIEKGGNILYVLASDNLYSYNTNDQSIQTYDKANTLSDCGISHIAWCQGAKSLVILYSNNNIDILDQSDNITNLSDYYNKSMTENKTVYSIDINGQYAYLSTGFGIVIVNVSKAEITNTYNLGFRVDYSYVENNYIYAASSTNGLYRGLMTDNLLDKSNWSRVGDYIPKTKTIDPELLALAQTLNPGGPKYNYFGFMRFTQGRLYTCNGVFGAAYDPCRPGTIQVLDNNEWTIYQDNIAELTGHSYMDLSEVDVDPIDKNHVYASGRTGLYEFKNAQFVKHYNVDNSPLQTASSVGGGNKDYVLTQGIKFDNSSNLWCLNSYSDNNILQLDKNNQWKSFFKSELMISPNTSLQNMKNILFDSRGLMWFINEHWNKTALICYQPSTEGIKLYNSFVNEDATTINVTFVRCIAEDKDRNIWIGTNMGPLQLPANQIGTDNDIFNQIKVPRNDGTNLADYLLTGVDVTCMAVDGGGRKWFGTNGLGVYLISEDNYSEIHHFTVSNSDIISDYIQSIALDPQTGEVFFGTDKGLCSYMSDATEPSEEMNKDNVYAYPNPVKPDYTGLITVTGLSYDADVKIITSNGVLVAQGRSNGGMFTWDGTDLKGKRVVSGVYFVETATSSGSKGTVCKIAIVR
jgi:hypothetical protein